MGFPVFSGVAVRTVSPVAVISLEFATAETEVTFASAASVTVSANSPAFLLPSFAVAVIFALPALSTVTVAFALSFSDSTTVATASSLEAHSTFLFVAFVGATTAVSVNASVPSVTLALDSPASFVTVIDVTGVASVSPSSSSLQEVNTPPHTYKYCTQ